MSAPTVQAPSKVVQTGYRTVLRPYQARIADSVGSKNGIVVLPTGEGKTFIFAEFCRRTLLRDMKAVVFVPKQVLVEQQAAEVARYLELVAAQDVTQVAPRAAVGRFMGGERLPVDFDILVSTPKAFTMAQKEARNPQLRWEHFGLVVFDEVQHCLKNDPYRKIAFNLPAGLQVCGVTASLSYALDEAKMSKSVEQLRNELRIEVFETASTGELQDSGYHARGVETEVAELLEKERGGLPRRVHGELPPLPPAERKPHLMIPTFWERQNKGTCTDMAWDVVGIVKLLEQGVLALDQTFESPAFSPRSKLKLAEWATYAYKRKQAGSSALTALYEGLQTWYDALRLCINSWEEDEELVIVFLRMKSAFEAGVLRLLPQACRVALVVFQGIHDAGGATLPRCAALMDELRNKRQSLEVQGLTSWSRETWHLTPFVRGFLLGRRKELRALIFVEQRLTAHVVNFFLQGQGIASAPLYATATPASAELSVPAWQAKDTLHKFRSGEVKVLVTTTVAEEGLDVPEANVVIRFDGVLNAVSFVQGRGRARQEGATQVMMRERNGRTVGDLEAVERAQQRVIENMTGRALNDPAAQAAQLQKAREAQKSRERNATEVLRKFLPSEPEDSAALAALNGFCSKTKVVLDETLDKVDDGFRCTLKYASCLRNVTATGEAPSPKGAKKRAALRLLTELRGQLGV